MLKDLFTYLIFLSVVFLPLDVNGQHYEDWQPNNYSDKILIDYAAFKAESPGKIRLEIYYKLFNNQLEFEKIDNIYLSKIDIKVEIIGDKGRKTASDNIQKSIRLKDKQKTKSDRDFRVYQSIFVLDPGKYDVKLSIKNHLSKKAKKQKFTIKLKKFKKERPSLSDVEFVHAIVPDGDTNSTFSKGDMNIIPSVTRKFGGYESDNKVTYYFEAYQGSEEFDQVLIISKIRHSKKANMSYRDSMTIQFSSPVKKEVRSISIDSMAPGEYELEIELRDKRHKKYAKLKRKFYVEYSPHSFLEYDYKIVLRMLSLIADNSEIKKMKKAETLTEKIAAFKEFWLKRDPTISTVENEHKREFYRRISYANKNFRFLFQKGWSVDRGRVYVRYGTPDQINDYPYSSDSHPYQIWHYFNIEGRYIKFIFVDENEDGEYRLTYPYNGLYYEPNF